MAGTGPLSPVTVIALAALVVLLLAASVYAFRSRRPGGSGPAVVTGAATTATTATAASAGRYGEGPTEAPGAPRLPPAGVAGSPWPGDLPPHIRPGVLAASGPAGPAADPGAEAAGRVSFGVGMTGIQQEEGALQVLWHGINDGSVPVAVQWGRPGVRVEGDRIEVRYVYDVPESGSFQPPRTHPVGPDEIVSRTALVPLSEISREPAGMTVQVFVAFGPAAELAAAQSGREAYRSWQQITYTRPRTIPRAS